MGLHARHDAELGQLGGEQHAISAGLLVQSLGVQDGGGQVFVGARGLEQHLAVRTAVLLGVLDSNALKTLANGLGRLVNGQNTLTYISRISKVECINSGVTKVQ